MGISLTYYMPYIRDVINWLLLKYTLSSAAQECKIRACISATSTGQHWGEEFFSVREVVTGYEALSLPRNNIILHRNLNKNPIFMIMCYHLENWRAFILINKVIICCGYLLKQDISAYSGYPYEPDLPVAAMCQYHNICHKPYYSTGQTLRMSETTATFILPASDGCQLL